MLCCESQDQALIFIFCWSTDPFNPSSISRGSHTLIEGSSFYLQIVPTLDIDINRSRITITITKVWISELECILTCSIHDVHGNPHYTQHNHRDLQNRMDHRYILQMYYSIHAGILYNKYLKSILLTNKFIKGSVRVKIVGIN